MFRLSPSLGTLLETGQGKVDLIWEPKGTDHLDYFSLYIIYSSAILESIFQYFSVNPECYLESTWRKSVWILPSTIFMLWSSLEVSRQVMKYVHLLFCPDFDYRPY